MTLNLKRIVTVGLLVIALALVIVAGFSPKVSFGEVKEMLVYLLLIISSLAEIELPVKRKSKK